MKPYSVACDQNREPILEILRPLLKERRSVLEIGSGTGQHAVYFGAHMPWLQWTASDVPEHHAGIRCWIDEAALSNVNGPLAIDVESHDWGVEGVDAVFSANTAHIMAETAVTAMLQGVGRILGSGGLFVLYGPFRYRGRHTSESNLQFDDWLRRRDPDSGVRDFERLNELADQNGMTLLDDHAMPANNRTLVWRVD